MKTPANGDTHPTDIHNPILDPMHRNTVNIESANVHLPNSDSDNQTIETSSARLEPIGLYASPFSEASESKSIEMIQQKGVSSIDSTDNESPASTLSSLSSNNEYGDGHESNGLTPIELFPEIHSALQLQDRPLFISNRIQRNHKLLLMTQLPTDTALFNTASILIVDDGLYQVCREFNKFKQILAYDEFKLIVPTFDYSVDLENQSEASIYDNLTLKQLNRLEQMIRDRKGHSIIGYSINEEVFLRALGEYPPAPDALSTRVLNFINANMVRDMSVSLRSGGHSLILFAQLSSIFFKCQTNSDVAGENFYYNNVQWFLFVGASVAAFNMLLLRSEPFRNQITRALGYQTFEKQNALTSINRLRLIEESMIGATSSWSSYCSLVNMPGSIITYGMIPVSLYALVHGWMTDDALYTKAVINMANQTELKTLWKGLLYSLTIGSFYSLGLSNLVLFIVFYQNIDDERGFNIEEFDLSVIRYSACAIALASHFARYPHAPIWMQRCGRYMGNFVNGTANALLDNFATFEIISMILGLTVGNNFSTNETDILVLLFGLQAICFLYSILTSVPATPDYPEYSIEPNPLEKTLLEICHEKINQVKRFATTVNHRHPEHTSTDIEIVQQKTLKFDLHSLFSATFRQERHNLCEERKTNIHHNQMQI